MLKRISKFFLTTVLAIGIVFSNGPFRIVSSLLDSYTRSQNIVDEAWHLSQDTNVVDNFNSLRHVADKIRIQESHAAITYQSASAVANSAVVTIAPSYPASIAQGDLLVMIIGMKPSTACSGSIGAAPEGWTAITNGSLTGAGGYGCAAPGADTGDMNVFSYYKIAEGNESGTELVRLITNNAAWAQIYHFTNATEDWSLAATTGSDATGNTSVSIAMSADPGVTSGDHILGAMVIPTDVTTPSQFSAEALTQTGITFGTVTEVSEPDSTTGNDIGGFVVRSSVSAGTSSAAPTLSGTAGGTFTNVRGPGIFIRIRATGTITYQAAGTLAYQTTTTGTGICPAHPASVAANDVLVAIIGMKPSAANSGSVTTPAGWTAITNGSLTGAGGYGTTLGADTGNTNVFSFYRTALGTEASERCFALATNNVSWAQMYRLSNDSDVWDLAATTGSDASGDTAVSIAMSADPGVTTGDHILGAMVVPTDVTTPAQFSAESFTQTSVTFGTVTEINEPDMTTGNDLGGFTVRSSVSSGTGSAAPTLSGTAGGTVTNVRGPGLFVRIRETPPTFEQAAYRLFNNVNSTDVGSVLAAQDTAGTLSSTGDAFRLRALLHIGTANLAASGQNFKLQFAEKSGTCDTGFSGESYADVTGSTVIAYNNNASPADGDNLTANASDPTHSGHSIVNQDYEEANNFTNTVAAVPSGQDGKWDFSLIDNGAPGGTAYCFRVVKSDGTVLDTYTQIPQISTAATLTFIVSTQNFSAITPGSPVFATSTLSVDTDNTTGWNVSVVRDDADTMMDLDSNAGVNITDQTAWSPGAATTTAGNAVRIGSFSNSGDVLAFRVMSASGTIAFRAPAWWGSADTYTDNANTLWAGFPSTAKKVGESSVSSGGSPALSTVVYYLDVSETQQNGAYSGGITYTAIMNP
jgi:hypothetical protein